MSHPSIPPSHCPAVLSRPHGQRRQLSRYVSALQHHMMQAAQAPMSRQGNQRLATHETQRSRSLTALHSLREV